MKVLTLDYYNGYKKSTPIRAKKHKKPGNAFFILDKHGKRKYYKFIKNESSFIISVKENAFMNIYDISKLSGVSITTVSRVLNGSDKVSEKTKHKVLSVMEETGYTPNAFARGLGLDSMRTVGILCVDSADPNACPNLTQSIGYLERELRRYNYDSVLYCVNYDMMGKAKCIDMMLKRRVDAIIIVGSFFIETGSKKNQCILDAAKTTPVWLINGAFEGTNIFSVLCDDYNATNTATLELIDSGAKDILFLYSTMSNSEKRKLDGYVEALKSRAIPVREEYIHCCPRDIEEGRDDIINLADKGLAFDAIVTCEDTLAMSVLKYAHLKNISMPDKLSVIGHGNSILARCCYPELSSVDNNIQTMCVTAISMLIRYFEGANIPAQTVISANLVHRATTKKSR